MMNNAMNQLKMNVAVSESSSIHSDRLYSIAREISGMGLDAFDYMEETSHSVSYIHLLLTEIIFYTCSVFIIVDKSIFLYKLL